MKWKFDPRDNPLKDVKVVVPEPVLSNALTRMKIEFGLSTEYQLNVKKMDTLEQRNKRENQGNF